MRFAVFCIGGLNRATFHDLRFEILDRLQFQEIASTIPPAPITAWTSAWTGVGPAGHGKVPGIKAIQPKVDNILDQLKRRGLNVVTYDESQLGTDDDQVDVGIFRVDSVADGILGQDLATAQESLNNISEAIESLPDIPYLIISAFGAARYVTSLNIDRFLTVRGLMALNGTGTIKHDQTYAYPANYGGPKPRMSYGIMLNTHLRKHGFMESLECTQLQGELLAQLNKCKGIVALASHQEYDIGGATFMDLPEIILKSPSNYTCFRCVGETDQDVISPYARYELSCNGFIAGMPESLIQDVTTVMDVKKAISRGMMAARGLTDEQ